MAQYRYDWSQDTIGQPPANVTETVLFGEPTAAVAEVDGKRVLRITFDSVGETLLTFDLPGSSIEDAEILIAARIRSPEPIAIVFGPVVRYQHPLEKFYGALIAPAEGVFDLRDADFNRLGSVPAETAADDLFWIRLRAKGTTISAAYAQDESPPDSWDIQVSDSQSDSGAVALYTFMFNPFATLHCDVEYVGIGTDGDPAPMPEAEPTELGGRSSTGTLAAASLDTQLSLSGRSASGARGEADVDTGVRLAGRSGTVTRAAAEVNSAIRLAGRSPTATRVDASVASRASLSGQSATPTRAQGAVRTGVILSGRSAAAPRAHAALDATVEFGGRSATATRARGDLRVPDATRLSGRSATVTRAAGRLVVDMVPPIVEEGIAVITRHHAVGTAMVRRQEALASITRVQEREARI